MRSFNKQDIRNWTLTGLTLLTPMVVYGASQLGANGLYIFAPNTKIVSAEVNENFAQLDDRIAVYEDAISVDALGNIGIGTNSPEAKLELAGPGSVLVTTRSTGSRYAAIGDTGGTDDGGVFLYNKSNALKSVIRAEGESYLLGGSLGIGTIEPSNLLTVKATDNLQTNYPVQMMNAADTMRTGHGTYGMSNKVGIAQTIDYTMDIGGNLIVKTGANVGIGTTAPAYPLDVNGQVRASNVSVTSDARLKRDIRPLSHALEGIQCLQGVSYYLRNPAADQGLQLGLIAQDVERCYPELVSTDPEGYKSVSYDRLVAPLIEAVKEQQQLIARQQQRLQAQEQALQAQQQLSAGLEARLVRIERTLGERP